MSDFEILDISLVSPRVWEEQIANTTQGLNSEQLQVMRQSLLVLHDQQIGITPRLMADLTPSLLNSSIRIRQDNSWFPVLDRLQHAHTSDKRKSSRQIQGEKKGILFSSKPEYVLLRIIAPLIDIACRRIGRSYLFCGDDINAPITESQYKQYSDELSSTLKLIAQNEDDPILDLFWQEKSAVLASISHPDTIPEETDSTLAEFAHLSTAIFLRLHPDLGEGIEKHKLRRLTVLRRLRNTRQREAGVAGIRVTRREEDLGDALLSEYLNDKVTRMDRFFNTGFFALEREPKRTKLRDVLLVGLLPPNLYNTLAGDFVKVCWFDLSMRLGQILQQLGLQRTEFRWVEGDATGYAHSASFFLNDIPETISLLDGISPDRFRRSFLTALRWLPRYLDTRASLHRLTKWDPEDIDPADGENQGKESSTQRWLKAAWQAQKEAVGWSHEDVSSQTSHLHADDFVYTHITAFFPASERPTPDGDEGIVEITSARNILIRLAGRLQAANRFNGGISITWVPDAIDALDAWYFDASQQVQTHLFIENDPELQIEKLAGRLVRSWMEQIIKEVSRA